MTILVTGATGKVGRQAVNQLHALGQPVRALVRRPAGLPGEALGDLTDVDSVRRALDGVDKVFLVWPFFDADGLPPVLEAIGERQIVYLSSSGDTPWALAAEALIEQTTPQWTFLRPTGFAGNALEFAPEIKTGDVVRAPYGKMARPLIHEYDMASVGVRALTEDGHAGKKYELSGPELVTQIEQVQIIGEVVGRPLRFEELTPEQAKADMAATGWPQQLTDSALDAWAGMLENPEATTSTVQEVTGEPAKTFREWAEDHAADFRTPLDTARQYLALFRQGDLGDATSKLFSADIVRVEDGAELSGTEIGDNMNEFVAQYDIHGVDIDGPYFAGDRFTVRFSLDMTAKATGERTTFTKISLYTVENGLIVREEVFSLR